ncbi:MAG: YicC family protein [Myxococcota bacterium]|jgi:uncharacterized protein (TIGR00255 family)|nr:YicC family protein [Myxococcota bacterium]
MRSMTGFGRGSASWNGRTVVIEIKSVNHRFLELRIRAPKEMLAAEAHIEQRLRHSLARGYCTVCLEVEGSDGHVSGLNSTALRALLKDLKAVAKDNDLELKDLTPILAQATELFHARPMGSAESYLPAVEEACHSAIMELIRSRDVEGTTVAAAVVPLISSIRGRTDEVRSLAAQWPAAVRQRLETRISELVRDPSCLDPSRLEQEVALSAERSDITEELSRLDAHLAELERSYGSDAPIGRRLEFLLQEIGRETNTLGAKAVLPRISSCVIDIKSDLDKLRELVANVE